MVRVEMFIVDIDSLHELIVIEMDVSSVLKELLAVGTILISQEPAIYTLMMEDMVTAQHPTHRLICDRVQADRALLSQELPRLQSNQHFLDFKVSHLLVDLLNILHELLVANSLLP